MLAAYLTVIINRAKNKVTDDLDDVLKSMPCQDGGIELLHLDSVDQSDSSSHT